MHLRQGRDSPVHTSAVQHSAGVMQPTCGSDVERFLGVAGFRMMVLEQGRVQSDAQELQYNAVQVQ
jgi:hypothetical protein